MKAVVVGAGGGIGQPLSLLLKLCSQVDELALYDLFGAPGVAADLSHISTPAKITGYAPGDDKKGLSKALTGADLVIIPAGFPRKPGMSRADLFQKNADVVRDIITEIADTAPEAFILVISNPVNSTVPISAEVLKKKGVFNPRKLFGVTTLDVVRAETFLTEATSSKKISIPVIGGHSGNTIVPLFSQASPAVSFEDAQRDALIHRIQFGGDEVVKAKDGAGSATLSMAQAGFRFAEAIIRAAKGEKDVVENSFVYVKGLPGGDAVSATTKTDFFSLPVRLGPNGIEEVVNLLPKVNEHEKALLEKAYGELQGSINEAYEYGKTNIPKPN